MVPIGLQSGAQLQPSNLYTSLPLIISGPYFFDAGGFSGVGVVSKILKDCQNIGVAYKIRLLVK